MRLRVGDTVGVFDQDDAFQLGIVQRIVFGNMSVSSTVFSRELFEIVIVEVNGRRFPLGSVALFDEEYLALIECVG